jgi:type IV pilus assembly protein PilB
MPNLPFQNNGNLTLEEILFKEGLLTQDQLSAIKLESINSGATAEKIIVEHNLVSPDRIAAARAQLLNVPYIKLEGKAISADILNLIPEPVAKRYALIPFEKQGDQLLVAMSDPLDLQVIQFIEKKSGVHVKPYLGLADDIRKSIGEQYSQNLTTEVTSALKEVQEFNPSERAASETPEVIREAPVSNIVSQLLDYAVKTRASDIHIEPEETKTRVRFRIDGILHEKVILPRGVHEAVISRVKILSVLKIDEKRLPQDGRFTYTFGNQEIDLRVSTLPTVFGEKVVMRLLPKTGGAPTMTELGIRAGALKNLDTQLLRPHGIILVTGPTGSGKTTTLYSVLTKISTTRVNVLTVEDPVEYQIQGVNQVQVNPTIGLTFASALRSFLRQDPNVIMVGEIRDTETADLAIQASLTGHQVFSTVHTNSAAGALPRLLDMGAQPFLLASAINCIIGQRVVRKLCVDCRQPYTAPPEVFENVKLVLGNLISAVSANQPNKNVLTLYKNVGCNKCNHVGYLGRIGIYEVLVVSEKIAKQILEHGTTQEIEDQSRLEGMITMKQDGYLKAVEGITTLEEVLRVAQD